MLLARDGDRVTATVAAAARAPKRLAAYWAVTEQGHVTAVKAGENQGVTLQHDFVVRDYETVPAWTARSGAPQALAFQLPTRGRRRGASARASTWSSSTPTAAGRCRPLKIGC